MKTSVIKYSSKEKIILLREDYLKITNNDTTASIL